MSKCFIFMSNNLKSVRKTSKNTAIDLSANMYAIYMYQYYIVFDYDIFFYTR